MPDDQERGAAGYHRPRTTAGGLGEVGWLSEM